MLVPHPLPAADAVPGDVSLADLHDFFAHPVRGFFRRLRIARPYDADEVKDAIPITLDALEKWGVGDRIVSNVMAGADPQAAMLAEQLSGSLPPLGLGVGVLTDITKNARPLVEAAQALRRGPQRTLDVDIDLGGGRRLSGTVGDVWGNNAVSVSFSNLGAKHRLAGWIDALALGAGLPDENWLVHRIGKHRSGGQLQQVGPLAQHEAEQWLRDLVALYDAGQREPLPLPVKTSLAWAEACAGACRERRRPRRQGPRRVGDAALQRLRLPQGGRRPVARPRVRRARRLHPARLTSSRGRGRSAPARSPRMAPVGPADRRRPRADQGDLT